MSETGKLLDELNSLIDSRENVRRQLLWTDTSPGIRSETQWHGVPKYSTADGKPMPVTAECLEGVWAGIHGLELNKYFTDPEYYLQHYLKMRRSKFRAFPDDTPLTRDIPVCFGVTHEAGLLGQRVFLDREHEPAVAHDCIVDEDTDLEKPIDLANNAYLAMVIRFYNEIKRIVGPEFNVIFPAWYRGPQGVALYIRGYTNYCMDVLSNKEFSHRLLRYITNAAKDFTRWRADFLDEPIAKLDLFNDDIPLMSPEVYQEMILPYEQELSEFCGGICYWHSCADITQHVAGILNLTDIELLDFGVAMEKKGGGMQNMKGYGPSPPLELRVHAKNHIIESTEEESKRYVREMIEDCIEHNVTRYVLRSSGMMSPPATAMSYIQKLGRWVELVRQVQAE